MKSDNSIDYSPEKLSGILLLALQKGNIRDAGGILINSDCDRLGLNHTEMYHAVRDLMSKGHNIQRIDAGGAPEWALL